MVMNGTDIFNTTYMEIEEPFSQQLSSAAEILFTFLLAFTVIIFSSYCLIIFLFSPRQVRVSFKNPTGFIMTWLSMLDFVSGFLLLLPMSITVAMDHEWVFGLVFCAVQGMVLQLIQNMANTLLMTVAVDRFCALVTPIKYLYLMSQLTRKTYVVFSVLVLLYSSFFPVTSAIYFNGTKFDGQLLCFIYSTSLPFTMSNFILNAVIPLVIMVSCYSAIVVNLCRAKQAVPLTATGNTQSTTGAPATPGTNNRSIKSEKNTGLENGSDSVKEKVEMSKSVGKYSVSEATCSRRHVSDAKQLEERRVIKRAYHLFLCITIIFILTWVPYMSVDFISKYPPEMVYKLTTYLIFTISLTNFPLFLAYNRSFRSASVLLAKMVFSRQSLAADRLRAAQHSQNTKRMSMDRSSRMCHRSVSLHSRNPSACDENGVAIGHIGRNGRHQSSAKFLNVPSTAANYNEHEC